MSASIRELGGQLLPFGEDIDQELYEEHEPAAEAQEEPVPA